MDLDWIWKSVLIVLVGTFLLRIAGRKSISQMTLAQTIIMIAIGSLLIQPVAGKNLWTTFGVGAILILTLIGMEFIQLKGDKFEKLITGRSLILIENGSLNEKNMKKLRITADQFEIQLRQKNVNKLTDVQWATLEPNGQVGFILKEEAQPVTKQEFQQLSQKIQQLQQALGYMAPASDVHTASNEQSKQQSANASSKGNIYKEVKENEHEIKPPKHLQ